MWKPRSNSFRESSPSARATWVDALTNPTYQQVCSGKTGHVEVAEITFDPAIISYSDLLHVFFTLHDPTTLNRQGNDVGDQYRSVIFYLNEQQKNIANDVIAELTRDKVFEIPLSPQSSPRRPSTWPRTTTRTTSLTIPCSRTACS